MLVAGGFGGVAWFLLRRYTPGELSEIDEVCGADTVSCRSAARWGPGQL